MKSSTAYGKKPNAPMSSAEAQIKRAAGLKEDANASQTRPGAAYSRARKILVRALPLMEDANALHSKNTA